MDKKQPQTPSTGASLGAIAFLWTMVNVMLRIGGVLDWRWICVLAPVIVYIAMVVSAFLAALIVAAIAAILHKS
jgi:hypothetical protein